MSRIELTREDEYWAHPVNEEIVNAVIHGAGLLVSLAASVALVASGALTNWGDAITFGVYAVSLLVVYAVSTLSHAVQQPDRKHLLRMWDQGTIYLLIAGTYTPFIWNFLSSPYCWMVFALVWGAALIGFYSKVFAEHRVNAFSAQTYILLGWVPAVTLFMYVPSACLMWMAIGGVSYTLGTFFLRMHRQYRYFHAIWHLWVILGSGSHFYAIYTYVLPASAGS